MLEKAENAFLAPKVDLTGQKMNDPSKKTLGNYLWYERVCDADAHKDHSFSHEELVENALWYALDLGGSWYGTFCERQHFQLQKQQDQTMLLDLSEKLRN